MRVRSGNRRVRRGKAGKDADGLVCFFCKPAIELGVLAQLRDEGAERQRPLNGCEASGVLARPERCHVIQE